MAYISHMDAEWRTVAAKIGGGVMCCPLPAADIVRVAGEDAAAFLDAQLMNTLPAGEDGCGYNGYCSPKGRLLCTLTVWRAAGAFFLLADRGLGADFAGRLKKYVLRAKVAVAAGDSFTCTGLIGGEGGEVAAAGARLLRLPGTLPRFAAVSEEPPGGGALQAREVGENIWEAARIFAGAPRITPATCEKFLPQQLNMEELGGLSFNKGCYPGQEVIARLHFLGKQKTKMFRRILPPQRAPQPGAAVTDSAGRPIGSVVTAARLPDGRLLVQAVLPLSDEGEIQFRAQGA